MSVPQRNTHHTFSHKSNGRSKEAFKLPGLPVEPDRDAWTCEHCETTNQGSSLVCRKCEGRLPVIALFTAAAQSDSSREEYILKWEVFESESVLLMPGNMIVPTKGSLNLNPEWQEGNVFTLFATNEIGTRQLSTKVTLSPPRIQSFCVAEPEIQIGHPTIFYWEVENASKLELDMDIGEVTGASFMETYLEKGGTCTLTATNPAGVVRATVDLSLSLPEIFNFYSGVDQIRLGEPVPLFWEVNNASQVFLEPLEEEVTGLTQVELYPDRSTTYVLRAINHTGEVSQTIDLILPPPRILHFGAETGISTEGEAIELSWEVENAYQIYIDQGIGEVNPVGRVKVKPQRAYTTYTMEVIGHSGSASQVFEILRFPIPLEEPEVLESPKIKAILKKNDHQIPDSLADLKRLEQEVKLTTNHHMRELRIKKAKEQHLTDDMLKLEKATLRGELRKIFKRLSSLFSNSRT
ncbi:MAG: hypothetical protein AAF587_35520 [Bacteroidota bacterium]